MEELLPYLLLALLLAAIVLLLVLLRRQQRASSSDAMQLLNQQLGQTSQQLTSTVQNLTASVSERLGQSQNLAQQSQKFITDRLETSSKTLGDLKGQLGQLSQATANILQVGTDIKKLQDILQSPKLRGSLGEWSLENLLAEVLPHSAYDLQHTFPNGTCVDALVILANGSVCIDAKFPLANFQNLLAAPDDQARLKCRREFLRDVKKHIDTIAAKYILPQQGTLDFALMYIPAESVYYETLIPTDNLDITSYAREKKVIPVSPNSLYAYLMAIATGLKGLQIEKNAKKIYQQLSQLETSLNLFSQDFLTLGGHLKNAHAKHDDASKKLDHLTLKLEQMHSQSTDQTDTDS
jgi:DNA recombination protein RmuC